MDVQAAPTPAPDDPTPPAQPAADDWVMAVQGTAAALWARARPAFAAALSFGTPGSMVFAALLGAAAFLLAAIAGPMDTPAEAAPAPSQPRASGLTEAHLGAPVPGTVAGAVTAVDAAGLPDPVGTAPGATVDSVLDIDVAYFWPATPQTVAEPVAIREGPSSSARLIRSARPGERLRINGKAEDAPGGPWLRVRLADGRDGYFASRTVDVGAFRRKRAAEAQAAIVGDPVPAAPGAPLIFDRSVSEESEIGPPSF